MRAQSMGLCDLSTVSQKLLCSPRKAPRRISKVPFKVLDAPELQVCSICVDKCARLIITRYHEEEATYHYLTLCNKF